MWCLLHLNINVKTPVLTKVIEEIASFVDEAVDKMPFFAG